MPTINCDAATRAGSLSDVLSVATKYQPREVWLFGSASTPESSSQVGDIDIAILGVPQERLEVLANALGDRFPFSRSQEAIGYTKRSSDPTPPPHKTLHFHFLVSSPTMEQAQHPIYSSIRNGHCIWRSA